MTDKRQHTHTKHGNKPSANTSLRSHQNIIANHQLLQPVHKSTTRIIGTWGQVVHFCYGSHTAAHPFSYSGGQTVVGEQKRPFRIPNFPSDLIERIEFNRSGSPSLTPYILLFGLLLQKKWYAASAVSGSLPNYYTPSGAHTRESCDSRDFLQIDSLLFILIDFFYLQLFHQHTLEEGHSSW